MNAMAISSYFALFVAVLAVWVAISVNRAPPPDKLAAGRYPGIDLDSIVSAWTRKAWLGRDRGTRPSPSPSQSPSQSPSHSPLQSR